MEEMVFAADPVRLIAAAVVGIAVLLILIIRFKLHPIISMMLSAVIIGVGAGMPLSMISETVEKGVGKTLQGIALLVGLGSMFGGILEASGGAQKIAETLIDKFGQKKAGWALGITGLVIGTTVFFEAGVVVLIPLVFSVVRTTKKSTLYYAIPLLAGLASGYAFVPPSAGSVLTANALDVNLGMMIMVGVPTAIISMLIAGIIWGGFIGNKIFAALPEDGNETVHSEKELPPFGLVLSSIDSISTDSSWNNIQICSYSSVSCRYTWIYWKTIFRTDNCYTCSDVFSGNKKRLYRSTDQGNF